VDDSWEPETEGGAFLLPAGRYLFRFVTFRYRRKDWAGGAELNMDEQDEQDKTLPFCILPIPSIHVPTPGIRAANLIPQFQQERSPGRNRAAGVVSRVVQRQLSNFQTWAGDHEMLKSTDVTVSVTVSVWIADFGLKRRTVSVNANRLGQGERQQAATSTHRVPSRFDP
jgi:hypothetical protein